MVLEAETGFDYTGHLQSERNYPGLSFGKGIAAQRGRLQRSIDIREATDYQLQLMLTPPPGNDGRITVKIRDGKQVVFERALSRADILNGQKHQQQIGNQTVTYDPLHLAFPYRMTELSDVYQTLYDVKLSDIPLEKGRYQLELSYASKVPSLVDWKDLHKFDQTRSSPIKPSPLRKRQRIVRRVSRSRTICSTRVRLKMATRLITSRPARVIGIFMPRKK